MLTFAKSQWKLCKSGKGEDVGILEAGSVFSLPNKRRASMSLEMMQDSDALNTGRPSLVFAQGIPADAAWRRRKKQNELLASQVPCPGRAKEEEQVGRRRRQEKIEKQQAKELRHAIRQASRQAASQQGREQAKMQASESASTQN